MENSSLVMARIVAGLALGIVAMVRPGYGAVVCRHRSESERGSHVEDRSILSKRHTGPPAVVEIDGYSSTRLRERDVLKDSVLRKIDIPLLRLSTRTETGQEGEKLGAFLLGVHSSRRKNAQNANVRFSTP